MCSFSTKFWSQTYALKTILIKLKDESGPDIFCSVLPRHTSSIMSASSPSLQLLTFPFFFLYTNFNSYRGELSGESQPGGPGVAKPSSEVMSAHFHSSSSGTAHRRLKMASDTSPCLICVCVWPWGPAWMLQEQGDRVQLLLLNADTHAEQRAHTHTITI